MAQNDGFDNDMLFTDGMISQDPKVGYRGTAAASASGISYRQLDYWDRTALVQPSVRSATGSGSPANSSRKRDLRVFRNAGFTDNISVTT